MPDYFIAVGRDIAGDHFRPHHLSSFRFWYWLEISFGWGAPKINSLTLIFDFYQLLLSPQLRYYLHCFPRERQLKYLSIDLSTINSWRVVEELCHFAIWCTHIIVDLLFTWVFPRRTWYQKSSLQHQLFHFLANCIIIPLYPIITSPTNIIPLPTSSWSSVVISVMAKSPKSSNAVGAAKGAAGSTGLKSRGRKHHHILLPTMTTTVIVVIYIIITHNAQHATPLTAESPLMQ